MVWLRLTEWLPLQSVASELGVFGHWMVALAPADPIVGGVVSTTVMVWLHVADWLPLQSAASQVRVSVKVPAQVPGVVTSLTRFTVAPPQVSEAVGGVKLGVFGHWMVALAPADPSADVLTSTTEIVRLPSPAWLPMQSVASQVRVSVKVPGQVPG